MIALALQLPPELKGACVVLLCVLLCWALIRSGYIP